MTTSMPSTPRNDRPTLFRTRTLARAYLLICLLGTLSSCEPDTTCYDRNLDTHVIITLSADSVGIDGNTHAYDAWDSLYIQGVGAETVLYSPTPLRQIGLRLRPDTTETAFLILYHDQLDTLVITHTPRLHYVSLACGCAVYHTITGARSSDTRVDSVSVVNASVETTEQENLRIYMHE